MSDPRCRSGKDCVAFAPDGSARTSQPGTICHGCIEAIQKCLTELPHLAAALNALKGAWGSTSSEARVSSSSTPQVPLNVAMVDMADEIWDAIDRTANYRIVDLITHPAEEWLIGGYRVVKDGVDRALDIRRVHSKAEKMVGFNKVWQRRAAACPDCHLPTLGSWLGEDMILCTNGDCLSQFTRTAYEELCVEQSRNQKGKKRNA